MKLNTEFFDASEISNDLNFGYLVDAYKSDRVLATMHHKPISKIIDFDASKTSG